MICKGSGWTNEIVRLGMVRPLQFCIPLMGLCFVVLPQKTKIFIVDNKNFMGYVKLQIGYRSASYAVHPVLKF